MKKKIGLWVVFIIVAICFILSKTVFSDQTTVKTNNSNVCRTVKTKTVTKDRDFLNRQKRRNQNVNVNVGYSRFARFNQMSVITVERQCANGACDPVTSVPGACDPVTSVPGACDPVTNVK